MTVSQDTVTRAINLWCVQNIWGEPAYESGSTIKLYTVGDRFHTNSVIIGNSNLLLPMAGQQYAVFWVDYILFNDSLIIPSNTWISTDTLGNDHQTLFHVYGGTGVMLPKASVFIYHSENRRKVYIAVSKQPLIKINGILAWDDLYLATYRYIPISSKSLTISSLQVPQSGISNSITAAITSAVAEYPNGTFVYVNGYDLPASPTIVLSPGDYVDIYTDATIFGMYSVNLTTETTGYFSSHYQVYKEVIHCPKVSNPSNLITTTEIVTITIRRNSDQLGAYLHRNEQNGVTQITHADIGINTEIINNYRHSLGNTDVSVEVRLRSHGNKLIREINYIDYLYILDDASILTFLTGRGDPSLPFWAATSLEQSTYIGYIVNPTLLIGNQTLSNFISGLGYYTVMAAICQHNKNFIIDKLPVRGVSVKKPLVLNGMATYPLVYLDGVKLRDEQVDYANSHHGRVVLGLTPDVTTTIGQTLTVELIESGPSIPYIFSPISGATTITVPFDTVSIFQVNNLQNYIYGYDVRSRTSLTQIVSGIGSIVTTSTVSGGGTTITFTTGSFGKAYIIQNGTFSRSFGLDVTSQVTSLSPIHIELTTTCSDNTTVVPFTGYSDLAVYLNGKRLVKGIDYSAIPIVDPDGNISIVQVLICNKSLLLLSGTNYVEVVAHTASTITQSIGYVTNNKLNIINNVEAWYNGLSSVYVGGILQNNLTDGGNYLTPTPAIGNGIPFQVLSEVPSFAANILAPFNTIIDDNRISLINTYLNEKPLLNDTSTLIIPSSWKVFSPYLTAICYDAIQKGEITLYSLDPDPVLFKQQFGFSYVLTNDPTINSSISLIDLRYCDIYPCYETVTVPDINNYTAIRRLATIVLPSDSDTLGDVVNA